MIQFMLTCFVWEKCNQYVVLPAVFLFAFTRLRACLFWCRVLQSKKSSSNPVMETEVQRVAREKLEAHNDRIIATFNSVSSKFAVLPEIFKWQVGPCVALFSALRQ